MNNIIEAIRNELKVKQYNSTKVLNYTGLSMGKYYSLLNGENVNLTDDEIWCLELRLFKERGKLLK